MAVDCLTCMWEWASAAAVSVHSPSRKGRAKFAGPIYIHGSTQGVQCNFQIQWQWLLGSDTQLILRIQSVSSEGLCVYSINNWVYPQIFLKSMFEHHSQLFLRLCKKSIEVQKLGISNCTRLSTPKKQDRWLAYSSCLLSSG